MTSQRRLVLLCITLVIAVIVLWMLIVSKSDTVLITQPSTSDVSVTDSAAEIEDATYKSYTDENLSFNYPSDWKLMSGIEFEQKYPGLTDEAIYVISPDAIIEITGEGVVQNGYVLQVIKSNEASTLTVDEIMKAPEGYGDSVEEITVRSLNFILYDFGWEGYSLKAESVTPGVGLYFTIHTPDKTIPEIWSVMREIVSSVEVR